MSKASYNHLKPVSSPESDSGIRYRSTPMKHLKPRDEAIRVLRTKNAKLDGIDEEEVCLAAIY